MWNPNPSNSVKFRGGNYAFLFDEDQDFPGSVMTPLISRASPAVEWAAFANISVGKWEASVRQHGGWEGWIKWLVLTLNTEIAKHLGDPLLPEPAGVIPPGVPESFDECQEWLVENLWFEDSEIRSIARLGKKPEAPGGPGPLGFVANQVFRIGKQEIAANLTVNADGHARLRFQRRTDFDTWEPVTVD